MISRIEATQNNNYDCSGHKSSTIILTKEPREELTLWISSIYPTKQFPSQKCLKCLTMFNPIQLPRKLLQYLWNNKKISNRTHFRSFSHFVYDVFCPWVPLLVQYQVRLVFGQMLRWCRLQTIGSPYPTMKPSETLPISMNTFCFIQQNHVVLGHRSNHVTSES